MKISTLLAFIYLFIAVQSKGQDTIRVIQADKEMSKGTHTGFEVEIPKAKLKDVEASWKKYVKRGDTDASVKLIDDEYQISGTLISNISSLPLNIYTRISETERGVRLTAFFTEDDSVFISSAVSLEKTEASGKLVRDFSVTQYRLAVEDEMNLETKKLLQYEKELDRLIEYNEGSHKNIKEYERKIERARTDIETNNTEQTKRRAEVANQKEIVRTTTPKTETYELEENKFNSLEKELKKLESAGEKMHGNIDGWEADIRQEQRNIEKNENQQKEKKETISKQKDQVKTVRIKLDNIR